MARPNYDLQNACELAILRGANNMAVRELADEHGVTFRTAQRYMAKMRDCWLEEEREQRPQRRTEFRRRLEQSYRIALDKKDAFACAAILRIWQKFDGLEEPAKLEIAVGVMDIRAMSPAERRKEIDSLLAMRAVAHDGTADPTGVLQPPAARVKSRRNGKTNGTGGKNGKG